eukprot:PhF_6_TR6239/c0_g1_i1/m.9432
MSDPNSADDSKNLRGIINLAGLMGSVGAVIILVAYFALPMNRRSTFRRLLTYQSAATFVQGLHYLQVSLLDLPPFWCAADATLLLVALSASACWSCCIAFHLFADLMPQSFRDKAFPIAEKLAMWTPVLVGVGVIVVALVMEGEGQRTFYNDFGGCFVFGVVRRIVFYYVPLIVCIGVALCLYVVWLIMYVRRSRAQRRSGSTFDLPHIQEEEDLSLIGIPLTERGVELVRYHLILLTFLVLRGGAVILLILEQTSSVQSQTAQDQEFNSSWLYIYLGEALQGFVNAIFFVLCFM